MLSSDSPILLKKERVSFSSFTKLITEYKHLFSSRIQTYLSNPEWCRKLITLGQVDCYFFSDQFVGLAAYYCNDQVNKTGFLTLFFVTENFQARGVAKIIFNDMLSSCAANGMESVELECEKSNSKANHFYANRGARKIVHNGEITRYRVDIFTEQLV